MAGQARFVVLLAAVSALLPLSGVLLVGGIGSGELPVVFAGAALAAFAGAGLVILGRAVIVLERGRIRR